MGLANAQRALTSPGLDSRGRSKEKNVEIVLPVDFVCSSKFGEDGEQCEADAASGIKEGFMGLDCGPETIKLNDAAIKSAKTIIWNCPMGVFEMASFESGTKSMMDDVVAATVAKAASTKYAVPPPRGGLPGPAQA